jgi:hypothetical protein
MKQSDSNPSPTQNFGITGKNTGKTGNLALKFTTASAANAAAMRVFKAKFVAKLTGNDFGVTGKL